MGEGTPSKEYGRWLADRFLRCVPCCFYLGDVDVDSESQTKVTLGTIFLVEKAFDQFRTKGFDVDEVIAVSTERE